MREEGQGRRDEMSGRKVEGARGEGERMRDYVEGVRPRGLGVGVREDICGARGKGEGQGMREER